jgi:hypothetical protein
MSMAGWKKIGWLVAGMAFCAAGVGGCGMQLETGYQFRPLNATEVQRRAFYASPFTDQKSAAEQEKKADKGPALGPSVR